MICWFYCSNIFYIRVGWIGCVDGKVWIFYFYCIVCKIICDEIGGFFCYGNVSIKIVKICLFFYWIFYYDNVIEVDVVVWF